MTETWFSRNKRTVILILLIEGLIIALLIASYVYYEEIKVDHALADQLTDRLTATVQPNVSFHMADMTPFDWDVMVMFPPYTSREEMEQEVGVVWSESTSFWHFLLEQMNSENVPLHSDGLHKLVFVLDDKVICDVTLDRSIDFTQIPRITEKSQAEFNVELLSDQRMVITIKPS